MKITITIAILFIVSGCSLKKEQAKSISILPNYSHSLSGKLRYKQRLEKIAKINRYEALNIAKKSCNQQEIFMVKLRNHNSQIFYDIRAKECFVRVDAMSGKVIIKEENS